MENRQKIFQLLQELQSLDPSGSWRSVPGLSTNLTDAAEPQPFGQNVKAPDFGNRLSSTTPPDLGPAPDLGPVPELGSLGGDMQTRTGSLPKAPEFGISREQEEEDEERERRERAQQAPAVPAYGNAGWEQIKQGDKTYWKTPQGIMDAGWQPSPEKLAGGSLIQSGSGWIDPGLTITPDTGPEYMGYGIDEDKMDAWRKKYGR